MQNRKVVTCFLEYDGKILLLKRSSRVGTYQGCWAGVAGYIENGRTALEQGIIEIEEETSLARTAFDLVRTGEILMVEDPTIKTLWLVHPLRFRVSSLEGFALDWEHTDCHWFEPDEILSLKTVPGLYDAWGKVV